MISARSAAVSFTPIAPIFSASRSVRLVPGIGTMSSPCASSHASASWPGVQPLRFAISATRRTKARLAGRFSAANRGWRRRASFCARLSGFSDDARHQAAAERRIGDKANAELLRRSPGFLGFIAESSENSFCTAASGCVACARRIVSGCASLMPSARTLPCSTSFAMAPNVSSTGTVGSTRCW